jgi:hypothetical protein
MEILMQRKSAGSTVRQTCDDPMTDRAEECAMSAMQIYDPALCCSSGVCGQEVDANLVQVAADIDWAKRQGAQVERFNLAQQPMAFAQNAAVRGLLERSGQEALPITLLDGEVVLAGRYPSRQQLGHWLKIAARARAPTRADAAAAASAAEQVGSTP